MLVLISWCGFFFKQKTAYEMRISDWSSDVCSSDLAALIDGASRIGVFWRIMLPLSMPGVITVAVLAFVTSWNAYILTLLLLQDDMRTLPLGEVGRASCRERVGQYVSISEVAGSLKKQKLNDIAQETELDFSW